MLNITNALNIFNKISYITYSPLGEGRQYATFWWNKRNQPDLEEEGPQSQGKKTFQASKVRY